MSTSALQLTRGFRPANILCASRIRLNASTLESPVILITLSTLLHPRKFTACMCVYDTCYTAT